MCPTFSINMKYFVLALVLGSGFLFQNGLSRKIESQEQLLDEKKINLDSESYHQENHGIEDQFPNNAACDCGPPGSFKGKCEFSKGIKMCECEEGFLFNDGICEECDCGDPGTFEGKCKLNEKGNKICECVKGYAIKNGRCEACDCGAAEAVKGEYTFDENGHTMCECAKGYAIKGGKCEACDCGAAEGVKGECTFDENGDTVCECVKGYAIKDGKCEECDCGEYGLCVFENGQKKCKCAPLSIEFKGKCVECNCGKSSKSCSYSTNGTKICNCYSGYVNANGLCTACDCGDNGLCEIESGQKKCICSPSYVEVNGKCQECECGEYTYSCVLDSYGKKKCTCRGGYKENNGYCAECYCGRDGTCRFVNGKRTCDCNLYYEERNGTCEFCSCGEKASSCYFDSNFDKRCKCYSGYAEKDGRCEKCDCGRHGSCIFENGRKRCKCNAFAVEKNGICIIMPSTTDPPTTTQTSTIITSTAQACDCGGNSLGCHLNTDGESVCYCFCGYLQNNGYCEECDCGPYGDCTFENGRKKCSCMSFAVEVNGVCVDFGTTSVGTTDSTITSNIVSSTVQECDCGSRGKCTFENGQKKCICDSFTIEKDGICVDCYCGENSKSCLFNWKGDKVCNCNPGYSQVYGFCYECNCGNNARSCHYKEDGTKVCSCDFGYTQTNGHCSAICRKDTCVNGQCENGVKCRCYKGFTGESCDEKITTEPSKQDLWMVMLLSVTFAIFVVLSGMCCFWTRILNKISKK